ncbi:MAG: Grx4 family monothiol glutaredoxin [Proteobacteria bacterium]|nr:MAG: Grx4 family monothiol glutaredoxin [Pseudomonadota bacterium]
MSNMDQSIKQKIEKLIQSDKVFLFMKGNPQTPMCGFSGNTVKMLKDLLGDDYGTFNVLEDNDIREGIKLYSDWPTIPQLYINQEFVGGNDIISEMFNTGELHELLDLKKPDRTPPHMTISNEALAHIKEGMKDAGNHKLFLSIDDEFNTRFSLDTPKGYEVVAKIGDLAIYMDIGTAERAQNIEISWLEELQGSGLRIKNPNEPPAVQELTAAELQDWFDTKTADNPRIYDVRAEDKVAEGTLPGAQRLDKQAIEQIESLDKSTPLVFLCQVGQSSMAAAEYFRKKGFTKVFNLSGGYDAWND